MKYFHISFKATKNFFIDTITSVTTGLEEEDFNHETIKELICQKFNYKNILIIGMYEFKNYEEFKNFLKE